MPGQDLAGEAAHFGQRGEIGERDLDLSSARPLGHETARRLGTGRVAAGHDDPHAGAGEAQCGVKPDPSTRPGNDADPRRRSLSLLAWRGESRGRGASDADAGTAA